MAQMLLFHSELGLGDGVLGFADRMRQTGHTVHTPDLFGGRTFASLTEGMAYREMLGMAELSARASAAVDGLPAEIVYAGFSIGAARAQMLAQTRAGARGALLMHGCVPSAGFGTPWPRGVPIVVHTTVGDPDVDLAEAQALVDEADDGELWTYPGSAHLFADPASPDYNPANAELMEVRILEWLDRR